ncbi:MAG: bifunctional phosphoribosyl-AMP cyclohydrolase/phosphoribosyl-ATP diphosphatase HisIE [Gammaproteobacteria bacterium]
MLNIQAIDFDKLGGLIPACIQDEHTLQVLMIGFMNKEALEKTLETKKVTFFSRTKNRLWTKGEESGNELLVKHYYMDCDNDTVLILAQATGPTCHTGDVSCFKTPTDVGLSGLMNMNATVDERARHPKAGSYTCELFNAGLARMAQKVGEEGVEVALAAVTQDNDALLNEAADLLFHLSVLLRAKDLSMEDVSEVLARRGK